MLPSFLLHPLCLNCPGHLWGRVLKSQFLILQDLTPKTLDPKDLSDTDCGIAHEVIDRIWDPFFTIKEVGKGIGLGLALSDNIIKRHGGEISVKSAVGKGSNFTVRLPVRNG